MVSNSQPNRLKQLLCRTRYVLGVCLRRTTQINRPANTHGSHTHRSSDITTAAPAGLRKRRRLSGLTSMTCIGKKKRSSEKGQANATPSPPLVSMSNKPCDAPAMNTNQNAFFRDARRCDANPKASKPSTAAKAAECEAPRWPRSCAYGIPKRNARTSRSDRMDAPMPAMSRRLGMSCCPKASPSAMGTAGCERMDGTWGSSLNQATTFTSPLSRLERYRAMRIWIISVPSWVRDHSADHQFGDSAAKRPSSHGRLKYAARSPDAGWLLK